MPRFTPLATVLINHTAHFLKDFRNFVDFIQHDQFVAVLAKVIPGVAQLDAVTLGFQIQIDGRPGFGDLVGKGRLANLPRANDGDSRKTVRSSVTS